jgi:hypothetical protein
MVRGLLAPVSLKNMALIALSLGLLLLLDTPVLADWQFWNGYSISGRLSERWKAKLQQDFRFDQDSGSLFLHQTDAGLAYAVTEWLDMGVNYRQIYQKDSGEWLEENRPHVNITFKWKWYNFMFSDRNRGEYRNREKKDDIWRYRNRLTVTSPIQWTKLRITPYISDEIIAQDGEGFKQNRLSAGFKAKLMKHLDTQISYLLRMEKDSDDDWVDTDIIGLNIMLVF